MVRMKNKRAFTLIELIVVIAIMVILAGITAPVIVPLLRNANLRAGAAEMRAAIMRARTMAITNSVYSVPLIPMLIKTTPTQYAIPGGAPDVWVDEDSDATWDASTVWHSGGISGQCHTDEGDTHSFTGAPKTLRPENVIAVWVWLIRTTTEVKLTINGQDKVWNTDLGNLPESGKWQQLAVSMKDLGLTTETPISQIDFGHSPDDGEANVWWDMVTIWDVYILPEKIVPDPTLTSYPIEFESDGRLKPTHGGHWSDRMIILKDLGNGDLEDYLATTDNATGGNKNDFWECEPFLDVGDTDAWYNASGIDDICDATDFGFDRVKGSYDPPDGVSGTDGVWSYEGPAGLTEPAPGQIYIKINKITGSARVCAHPGE